MPINLFELKEHIRRRPAMYMGKNGIVGLIRTLVTDCIYFCHTDEITFEIALTNENKFSLRLSSKHDLNPFIESFRSQDFDDSHRSSLLLKTIAEEFEISRKENGTIAIDFSFDKEVIKDTQIDYLLLNEELLQIAILNRNTEILAIDTRRKYPCQDYYHFPEGVMYLFERVIAQAWGKPNFKVIFDNSSNSHKYQIGLAYRTDWYPNSTIVSFANDTTTICGGSLVDGIIEGLAFACREFAEENNLTSMKIKRKKLSNGLILVCAVRGDNLTYGGSFRETLENGEIKKDAKKIAKNMVLEYFRSHQEIGNDFLKRFDPSDPLNVMYY